MILRTKKYSVGCGVILHPNASSDRCGQPTNSFSMAGKGAMQLCDNCRVRQHANALMDYQEKHPEVKP